MTNKYYDIIIIGSGMAGLFSAYTIKKISPRTSFLVLEKFKKKWLGGRTSNEDFYGTEIVTGAGIGRKDTNPLLMKLMDELHLPYQEFKAKMNYSSLLQKNDKEKNVDIVKIMKHLKSEYKKHPEFRYKTFKDFFISIYGDKIYNNFVVMSGYSDYENADILDTLDNYGMEDNKEGWTALHIRWKELVDKLYEKIGGSHFKFSSNVTKIEKKNENSCIYQIEVENGTVYHCNKVIVATTISGIQKLVPELNSVYKYIHSQPFLRVYAKFDKKSCDIMKKYVVNYTIVPGPLQKIIPIDADKGVYMIAYSDNKNAQTLKQYLQNTEENRKLFCGFIEKALGIPEGILHILSIISFYWPEGTHYYEPLPKEFKDRSEFIYKAQHPEKGILVVGEAVSRYQGWVEGALESVETGLTNKWVLTNC